MANKTFTMKYSSDGTTFDIMYPQTTIGQVIDLQTELDSKPESLTDLGVTATSTELNYTSGVTSNIQNQLNTKIIVSDTQPTTQLAGDFWFDDTSLLPKEFVQCNYIGKNGWDYIGLDTGVLVGSGYRIHTKIKPLTDSSYGLSVLGGVFGRSFGSFGIITRTGAQWYFNNCGPYEWDKGQPISLPVNEITEIDLTMFSTNQKAIIGGSTVYESTSSIWSDSFISRMSSTYLGILGRYNGGTEWTLSYGTQSMQYYLYDFIEIYNSDNELVRNYIPAYPTTSVEAWDGVTKTSASANEPGIFDTVEKKFYIKPTGISATFDIG